MNKLVIAIIIIFLLFTIINAYTVPINLLEFANDKNNFGIGLGLIEQVDKDKQAWDVFPLHFYLKSGDRNIFLLFNMISIVFKGGTNYSKPINSFGTYTGDVVSVGGQVIVSGRINGDIWAFNADVILYKNSVVTGNIVAIGGRVYSYQPVYVEGTKLVTSDLQFPLMGIVISPNTGNVFQISGFGFFPILFFVLILFLYTVFGKNHLTGLTGAVTTERKSALIFTLVALLCIPIVVILLISSKAGLLIVPFFVIFLLACGYIGFIAVAERVGQLVLRGEGGNVSRLFFTGCLGFVMIHGLTIIGLLFSLFTVDFLKTISGIFLTLGAIVSYVAFIYGLGVSLSQLKKSTN